MLFKILIFNRQKLSVFSLLFLNYFKRFCFKIIFSAINTASRRMHSSISWRPHDQSIHEMPFPLLKCSFIRAYKIWFVKVKIYWSRCMHWSKEMLSVCLFLKMHLKVKTNQEHFVWRMAKQKKTKTFIMLKMWFVFLLFKFKWNYFGF